MGQEVCFDGGHKHDTVITETLGKFFHWVPVSPEVEIGIGTPRGSLRLVGIATSPKLIAPRSGSDHTERMQHWAKEKLEQLQAADLHGYILKKGSSSCGMALTRRHGGWLYSRAFLDRVAWTFYDPDHSESEHRFITIGFSANRRLLFVAHADQGEETVRIISARKATPREQRDYARIS